MRLLPAVLLAWALASGCTNYHYIVRTEGAPLYAEKDRRLVIARMERLDDATIGHFEPEGDPVAIRWRGLKGYANRRDLRLFKHSNDDHARRSAVFRNRREVVLEGKDWPDGYEQAVRESRVENGMSKEMVELSWGRPNGVQPLGGGAERWSYERLRWDVFEDVEWGWYPGYSRIYYGYGCHGPGWGYGYAYGGYEPIYTRTYYARTERRSVTFSEQGTVTGWETTRS